MRTHEHCKVMSSGTDREVYVRKALDNLASAESEFAHGRFDAAVNRAYYACFQAAIAELIRHSIRPHGREWGHAFVQSQFAGQLITRRKIHPATLRDTLPRLESLREKADYEARYVSHLEAERALSRARQFLSLTAERRL